MEERLVSLLCFFLWEEKDSENLQEKELERKNDCMCKNQLDFQATLHLGWSLQNPYIQAQIRTRYF